MILRLCVGVFLYGTSNRIGTLDKVHERTNIEKRVDRERVTFSLCNCDLLQWDQKVPHMQNSKGGDLYLYPRLSCIEPHEKPSQSSTFMMWMGNPTL